MLLDEARMEVSSEIDQQATDSSKGLDLSNSVLERVCQKIMRQAHAHIDG